MVLFRNRIQQSTDTENEMFNRKTLSKYLNKTQNVYNPENESDVSTKNILNIKKILFLIQLCLFDYES